MCEQAYHTLYKTPLAAIGQLSRADLSAFARTCPRRVRLKLLAVAACLLSEV